MNEKSFLSSACGIIGQFAFCVTSNVILCVKMVVTQIQMPPRRPTNDFLSVYAAAAAAADASAVQLRRLGG